MKTLLLNIGITLALFFTGTAYSDNAKVTNPVLQIKALEAEALKGNPKIQLKLASMYMHGMGGVAVDRERAISWYKVAAEHDIGYAQQKLAHIFLDGKWVEQSNEKALYWLTRAARLGYVDAQLDLSSFYETATAVPQDFVSAYKWLSIAASLAELDIEARQSDLEAKMSFLQLVHANYLSRKCILKNYQDC